MLDETNKIEEKENVRPIEYIAWMLQARVSSSMAASFSIGSVLWFQFFALSKIRIPTKSIRV